MKRKRIKEKYTQNNATNYVKSEKIEIEPITKINYENIGIKMETKCHNI